MLFDDAVVRANLSMGDCVEAVESCFAALARGDAPRPGVLGFEVPRGGLHLKATAWPERGWFVAKVNSNYPGNPGERGLPTIQGLLLLYELEGGRPVAVLDSAELTARRTGAATGVAVKHLAVEGRLVVTLIGCGRQAEAQLEAVAAVRDLDRVRVFDARPEAAQELERRLRGRLPLEVVSEWRQSARESDVVITCTPARALILDADDVSAGCLVAAVGADNPHKQEIAPELLSRAKIVCDVTEQCAVMGDLHHAIVAGVIARDGVHAELGEVVAGLAAGRESEEEIIVFDSTGMALQDLVAAVLTYENATGNKAAPVRADVRS
jgi:alanine dehydrogenase